MRTRKLNRGGGFFDFFRSKKQSVPVSKEEVKSKNLKYVKNPTKVISPLLYGVKAVDAVYKKSGEAINVSGKLGKIVNPLESVIHSAAEIVKIHPIGYLLVGTLLFIKKLRDLYKNHKYIVEFITQVETISENSYRLNELIDKINETMVIYTFNNEEYKNRYSELFELEKEILNNKDDSLSQQLEMKEKELFDSLLDTANNNKNEYRSNLQTIDFDNLDKFIEPNKIIKQQLTVRIAEINKYLLSIATNDMLNTLKSDVNINKSGLIRLVLDEINAREKRRFKWFREKKRYWYRANNLESIMRKLNDDLIMMNSLFILMKFQMDFTLEYYKNQNISTEEWNDLWKLITSFKEYTSYMIPSEVFMTIKTLNNIIEINEDSKNAVSELGNVINELSSEEEKQINTLVAAADVDKGQNVQDPQLGGKAKTRRIKTRRIKTRRIKTHRINNNRQSYKKKGRNMPSDMGAY